MKGEEWNEGGGNGRGAGIYYSDRQSAKARPRFRIILKYRSAPGGMSAPSGSNSPSLMSRPPN